MRCWLIFGMKCCIVAESVEDGFNIARYGEIILVIGTMSSNGYFAEKVSVSIGDNFVF